jgi:type IV pilus assembly protein PilB
MPNAEPVVSLGLSRRLGELLVEERILTAAKFAEAVALQRKTGEKLGTVLVKSGFLSQEELLQFLARQCGMKYVHLAPPPVVPEAVKAHVPVAMAKQHLLLPLSLEGRDLTIAVADPLNVMVLDDLKMITGFNITAVLAPEVEVLAALDKNYSGAKEMIDKLVSENGVVGVEEVEAKSLSASTEFDIAELEKSAEEAPVVRLVNLILAEAITARASDIHIEPFPAETRVRYRIDGVLIPKHSAPPHLHNKLMTRIKIMSNLNIAERRLPQDGRLKLKVSGKTVDMRVSVLPCAHGEKVVMRVLDSSGLMVQMSQLGFEPEAISVFSKCMKAPYGINLITGPTGSGKSTTLYSALSNLNTPGVNIVTVEDPVEYQLLGINQVQVNNQVGLTFAEALRSFLRQDPNVIMVGEVRDLETAQIAVNAALTGHLVFATLHTNDAPSSITRLGMMGVEPFLISSALLMVVAQRLTRVICAQCKESYEVDMDWLVKLGVPQERLHVHNGKVTLWRGKGCDHCAKTGYRGRQGLYEVLEVNDLLRDMILKRASTSDIRNAARKNGLISLRECAIRKLLSGATTAEEMLRVTAADS